MCIIGDKRMPYTNKPEHKHLLKDIGSTRTIIPVSYVMEETINTHRKKLKSTSIYIENELFDAITDFNTTYIDDKIQRSAVCRAALKDALESTLKKHGLITVFKKKYPSLWRDKQ
jgi:uncharacterized protein YwqG